MSIPYTMRQLRPMKKGSLDLSSGPAITITPMSEVESDADTSSGSLNPVTSSTSAGMNYLSPFTIITTCSSRTTSESNLSSSGYSSMASPGPSRYVPLIHPTHCTNKVLQTNFPKCALIHIFRTAKNPTFIWTMSNKSTWVLPIT